MSTDDTRVTDARLQYHALFVACPTCQASSGESCRTKAGHAVVPEELRHSARLTTAKEAIASGALVDDPESPAVRKERVFLKRHGDWEIYVDTWKGYFTAYPRGSVPGDGSQPKRCSRLSDLIESLEVVGDGVPAIGLDGNNNPVQVSVISRGFNGWRVAGSYQYRDLFVFDADEFDALKTLKEASDHAFEAFRAAVRRLKPFTGKVRKESEE